MGNQYVEPQYIKLAERTEEIIFVDGSTPNAVTLWTASAQGPLTPSRMWVNLSRDGASATDALQALTEAVEEQGWKVADA